MTTRVRVVVVNFNGGDLVLGCISSVLAHDTAATVDVVVVDNASTDGSPEAIARRFGDDVILIRNATNDGFVAANAAMVPRHPTLPAADVVMLLNPDATVEPGCIDHLLAALEAEPDVGAAAPCMLFADRFADVVVEAPLEDLPADPRPLAVELVGLEVADADRMRAIGPGAGVYDLEWRDGKASRWLGTTATIGVPVPLDTDADAPQGDGTVEVCLWLLSPTDKEVRVAAAGGGAATVVATDVPTPVTVTVPTGSGRDLIANAGTLVFADGTGADRGHYAEPGPPWDQPTNLFAWCGGAVALSAAYLDDVGLFADELFLYYEDVDLSWRGRRQGWRHRYVPGAKVRHVQGASGGTGSDLFVVSNTRNRLLVVLRNASWPVVGRAVASEAGYLWASVRHELLTPWRRHHPVRPRMVRLRLRGLASALAASPRALWNRWRLQMRARRPRRVTEAELLPPGTPGH